MRPRVRSKVPIAEGQEISPVRKGAAALSLAAAGGTVAWETLRHLSPNWVAGAFGVGLIAGGYALTRRSLVGHTLARAGAWTVLIPGTFEVIHRLSGHHLPGFTETALTVTAASALALARPMLHSRAAKASFDPRRFRRWLLAGSTATVTAAILLGGVGLEILWYGGASVAAFAQIALAVAMGAAAVGVVRMRAWGILLGALTSFTLLVTAVFAHRGESILFELLAAPTLALHTLPILYARLFGSAPTHEETRYRVAEPAVRVAMFEDEVGAERDEVVAATYAARS